ncbi:MAG: acyl-CoA dehydrogenase family protein [Burkholderiaceae bacterium]
MRDTTYLALPLFEARHRELESALSQWCDGQLANSDHHSVDVDDRCRDLVSRLGAAGWLKYCVPAAFGGQFEALESRSICLLRETIARYDGLADFSFAMQGLGSGPLSFGGNRELQSQWLPAVARGEKIAAFALSEPDAGSDVAAMQCRATQEGEEWVLNGEKTWISNGGIADFYCVFARSADEPGARGISAFLVPAETPGLHIAERIDVMAPHPLATLAFEDCRIPANHLLGEAGAGFKLAMSVLDVFRSSVAAAALGFARRALQEALAHAGQRKMFGQTLADFQLTQAGLAEMATDIDASALLTYRAAWQRDVTGQRTTREAAMAKMTATESAQKIIDRAVQMFGGLGVTKGQMVESLYREIRALRIYEGATEVQKLIIARELLKTTA